MDILRNAVENHHRRVRENSFELWKRIKDESRGIYLVKSATVDEFNRRTDFLTPQYVPMEKIAIMHSSVTEYAQKYDPQEGFIYVIEIDQLPTGYGHRSILSPQLVYKHADRD